MTIFSGSSACTGERTSLSPAQHNSSRNLSVPAAAETFSAVLHDISEGGVLLECEKEFPVGSEVCLEIEGDDKKPLESYVGKVVRKDDMPSWFPKVAIEFDLENPHPPGGVCSVE